MQLRPGSESKGGFCQASWQPEFGPWNLCKGGRRELIPALSLSSHVHCDPCPHTHYAHTSCTHNNNTFLLKRKKTVENLAQKQIIFDTKMQLEIRG